MHKNLVFVYCHGGGGSWLGNLIWHLENSDFSIDVPKNNVFDSLPRSGKHYRTGHSLEYYDPETPTFNPYTTTMFRIVSALVFFIERK